MATGEPATTPTAHGRGVGRPRRPDAQRLAGLQGSVPSRPRSAVPRRPDARNPPGAARTSPTTCPSTEPPTYGDQAQRQASGRRLAPAGPGDAHGPGPGQVPALGDRAVHVVRANVAGRLRPPACVASVQGRMQRRARASRVTRHRRPGPDASPHLVPGEREAEPGVRLPPRTSPLRSIPKLYKSAISRRKEAPFRGSWPKFRAFLLFLAAGQKDTST